MVLLASLCVGRARSRLCRAALYEQWQAAHGLLQAVAAGAAVQPRAGVAQAVDAGAAPGARQAEGAAAGGGAQGGQGAAEPAAADAAAPASYAQCKAAAGEAYARCWRRLREAPGSPFSCWVAKPDVWLPGTHSVQRDRGACGDVGAARTTTA